MLDIDVPAGSSEEVDWRLHSGFPVFQPDVDVVVGCFYGDEGKGQVAKWMADKFEKEGEPYQWSARVGAQNAEHRITHQACDFTARIFPSACVYRPDILAVLGAGHCFIPSHFFKEAVHLGIPLERVYVDGNAMWLREDHAVKNLEIANARGSTGWGIGQAIAEKVKRRPGTLLIGDCPEMFESLGNRLTDVPMFLQQTDGPGLFEGSQGAFLSLDHGFYPHCTAKNVTVPAICGELGLNLKRVRSVIGVTRLVMMRVPGASGPVGAGCDELTYDEVEDRTGLRLPNHRRLQGDSSRWNASTRGDKAEEERLFDITIEELYRSHVLNGYDGLAVTFADYHRFGNYRVRRWGDLHPDTRELISEFERNIAPVVLIRTGQGEYDYIER